MLVLREHLPLSQPYVAPRSPTEQRLAEIWRKVLSMDAVGIDDDYFDLGGDSLMATVIFAMIDSSFGVALPIGILAEASTIARLAPKVDALLHSGHHAPAAT
jgi:acyl carrier protein